MFAKINPERREIITIHDVLVKNTFGKSGAINI